MFSSSFRKVGNLTLPDFTGIRIMMLPIILGDPASIPDFASHYRHTTDRLFSMSDPAHQGKVGYLTVDEKRVEPKMTHRRAGMHVDGVFEGRAGGWGGGGGGGWGSVGNGMLTVSSHPGCRAWSQDFSGWPGDEGECDHLLPEVNSEGTLFGAGEVFWVDGLCVHESVPMKTSVDRQFVRLSMPSDAPWFEGYTENPLGVTPTGEILPMRKFMK